MGFVGNYAPVDFHHRLTACLLYEKMDVSCKTQKNIHLTPSMKWSLCQGQNSDS